MSWQTATIIPNIEPLEGVVDGVLVAADTAIEVLTAIKSFVDLAASLAINVSSAAQLAIQAAAKLLTALIDDILSEANPGIYILLVPPRGVPLIPAAAKVALGNTKASLSKDLANTQSLFTAAATSEEIKLLNAIQDLPQGNAGFVRTVLDSLSDQGDLARPTMADDQYIAGVYLVTGTPYIAGVLSFIRFIKSLVFPTSPQTLMLAELPVPRNVRGRVGTSSSILIEWERDAPAVYLEQYKSTAIITEVAIIRSTSPEMLSVDNTSVLFGTTSLTKGLQGAKGAVVVNVVPYAANLVSYLDTDTHEKDTSYYYAVSYRVKLMAREVGRTDDVGFDKISNVAKVYIPKKIGTSARSLRSTPPDWYRTPRVVDVLPIVAEIAAEAKNFIQQQVNTTKGYADLIKLYADLLQKQIDKYTALSQKIRGAIVPLKALSQLSGLTASYRSFSGQGGVNYLRKDIVQAFADKTDPNRPPYDDDQFVTGIVLVASTPTADTLLKKLLGFGEEVTTAVAKALAAIDKELASIEDVTFSPDFQKTGASTSSSALTSTPAIGDDPAYCYHSFSKDVMFGDNFQPASA